MKWNKKHRTVSEVKWISNLLPCDSWQKRWTSQLFPNIMKLGIWWCSQPLCWNALSNTVFHSQIPQSKRRLRALVVAKLFETFSSSTSKPHLISELFPKLKTKAAQQRRVLLPSIHGLGGIISIGFDGNNAYIHFRGKVDVHHLHIPCVRIHDKYNGLTVPSSWFGVGASASIALHAGGKW